MAKAGPAAKAIREIVTGEAIDPGRLYGDAVMQESSFLQTYTRAKAKPPAARQTYIDRFHMMDFRVQNLFAGAGLGVTRTGQKSRDF